MQGYKRFSGGLGTKDIIRLPNGEYIVDGEIGRYSEFDIAQEAASKVARLLRK